MWEACHINPKEQSSQMTRVKRKREEVEKQDSYYLWLYPLYSVRDTGLEE